MQKSKERLNKKVKWRYKSNKLFYLNKKKVAENSTTFLFFFILTTMRK